MPIAAEAEIRLQHFTEKDVRRQLSMRMAIEAMRTAFTQLGSGEAQNQPRRRLNLPGGAVLHSLAGSCGRYFGTKVYSTHPAHGAWFTFLLFDAETAKPLAQFEANYLGQIRTGAVSGLAADLLAPERELDVAVIGSGFQARSQVEGLAAVRSIRYLRIWSRDPAKRTAFAGQIASTEIPTAAVESAAEALAGADVVITATSAKNPVFEDGLVAPTSLVLAMGSNDSKRRELPPGLVQSARVVVDDVEAARIDAGDLLLALTPEAWTSVEALAALTASKEKIGHRARLTVFKSVGLGIEDVAAAAAVYELAAR